MQSPTKPSTTSSTRSPFNKAKASLAALAMILSLSLSACATTSPPPINPEALIPTTLTVCADAPKVPDRISPGEPRSDAAQANYVVGLYDAYKDCKATVEAVKAPVRSR